MKTKQRTRTATGFYRARGDIYAARYVEEFRQWCREHGIPFEHVPFRNCTIVVGGGRVRIDFILFDAEANRGTLTVPFIEDLPIPTIFYPVTHPTPKGIVT